MPRFTIIERLPLDVRAAIDHWRIDDHLEIDQILERLKAEYAVELARSTLGEHVQKIEAVGAKIRELRAVSEGLTRAIGAGDTEKVGALNRELAHSILMRLSTATDEDGKDILFKPMEAMLIAKALDHLAHAEQLDIERALKVRKETAEKAVKEVEKVLKSDAPGLSADTVAKIKRQVLGVAT